jgi:hypothetical protein
MAKKKAAVKAAKQSSKIARQKALPGMENAKIASIENAALDYVEIRDARQKLTIQEVDLKTKLIGLMHKAGKTEYVRGPITIKLVVEKEKVKVRVRDEDEAPKPKKIKATDFEPESVTVQSEPEAVKQAFDQAEQIVEDEDDDDEFEEESEDETVGTEA